MRVTEERLRAIAGAFSGTSQEARKRRMLAAFEEGGITAEDARTHLDILFPYATINSLRNDGHHITTRYRWSPEAECAGLALYISERGAE